jgi:multidrug resistance efflux pump
MSHRDTVERIVRNRVARISVATVIIAVSAWAFSPYLSSRVSSSAFVNAELVRVNSPFAGRLTEDLPRRGAYIAQPRSVTLVQALAPDQRHLFDLREQQATAKERASLASAQLNEISGSDDVLKDRAVAYQAGMVDRLAAELAESTAESKGCAAEAQQRRSVGERMDELVKRGTASEIRSAEARATQEATSTRCDMADARMKRLTAELEAARKGIFLRDGANDAPYSQQQRDRLVLRRQELQVELLNETSKAQQLGHALEAETQRLTNANRFDFSLPGGYVVWSTSASPGSTVIEGQSIMDLADCRHRFVAVELPERSFEQIKAGDRADVRLVGSDAWIGGVVRQVRGSAANPDERLLAARVPKPSSGSITVEVDLPADVWLEAQAGDFCGIGRLAEVRFPRTGKFRSLVGRATGPAVAASK